MGCINIILWMIVLSPITLTCVFIHSIIQHRKEKKKEKQEQRIRDKIERMLDEQNNKTP